MFLYFYSSSAVILAVYRIDTASVSVSSIHCKFEALHVQMKAGYCSLPGSEASVIVSTDSKTLDDTDIVKPRMLSPGEGSGFSGT